MVATNETNTHGLVKRPLWRSHGVDYVAVTNRIPDHAPGDVITGISKRMLRYYFCHFHCGPKDHKWTELAIKQFKQDGKRRTRYISTKSRTNYKQFVEPRVVKAKEAAKRVSLNEDVTPNLKLEPEVETPKEVTPKPKAKRKAKPKVKPTAKPTAKPKLRTRVKTFPKIEQQRKGDD